MDLVYAYLNKNKWLTPQMSRPFKFPRLQSIKKKKFTHSNMNESYIHTVKQNKPDTKWACTTCFRLSEGPKRA